MGVRNVRRWQWVLASLVIGVALGYFQQLPAENWQKRFGDTITQSQFEEGLTREQSGMRWFRDVVVYPERIEVGGKTLSVVIVTGEYFNGKLEMQNGQRAAVWRRRCHVVDGPYQPIVPVAAAKGSDSVFAYLDGVKGVRYTYAWWRDPTAAVGMWTAGSFVVIGLLWPTAINLIVFGSVYRPKGERGMDLGKVPAKASEGGAKPSEADLAAVSQMGEELEAKLTAEPSGGAPIPQGAGDAAKVRSLNASALEAATEQPHEKKDFGRDRDDFYPTERHRPHPSGD